MRNPILEHLTALADTTRNRILLLLERQEMTAGAAEQDEGGAEQRSLQGPGSQLVCAAGDVKEAKQYGPRLITVVPGIRKICSNCPNEIPKACRFALAGTCPRFPRPRRMGWTALRGAVPDLQSVSQ